MVFLRSVIFNVFFYASISIWMIVSIPLLLLPSAVLWQVVYLWSRTNVLGLRWLAGVRVELRGLDNLSQTPVIYAAKHQSAFETVSLLHLFERPAYILKQELMRIPLLGRFARKMQMIPIDRKAGQKALRLMMERAREVLGDGRQIIIFPEGTRRPPGAAPAYKHGIVHLYKELGVAVVPVALNSGLFWPRQGFARFPGKLVVEFLPAIEAGLDGRVFLERLTAVIEAASDRLLADEASRRPPDRNWRT